MIDVIVAAVVIGLPFVIALVLLVVIEMRKNKCVEEYKQHKYPGHVCPRPMPKARRDMPPEPSKNQEF